MVLKRLLVTTLSALGLGALVAGPAFGQAPGDGNIPAPNLFDDQIACSMNVPVLMGTNAVPMPSMPPTGSMVSPLDELLRTSMGMGDPQQVDATDTSAIGSGTYTDLVYTVPADGSNCGLGTTGGAAPIDAATNAIAAAVASGYTAVKTQYDLVVSQETVVENARTALRSAQMAATATNPNTAAINSAQTVLDNALEELTTRENALARISGTIGDGTNPIYQAGIAEWRAMMAVETAVTAWNEAVLGVTADDDSGALDILDASTYGTLENGNVVSGYIALSTADPSDAANTGSVANVLNTDGTVNIANLRSYVGTTGAETTDNFNDDGSLLVPMRATLDPDDGNAMEPTPIQATIAVIRADVEAANNVVTALEEAQAKNVNRLLDDIYTEGLRRARLEAAHLNAQWANAIADSTDLVTDIPDDPATPNTNEAVANTLGEQSIRTRYAAYEEAVQKRDMAEMTLRTSVATRETATKDLINSFTSPGSFYQQLVDRRQALLDVAQNNVNRVVNAGGTPTTALNTAVEDAQKALDTANEVKGNYDALVSDADNPAVSLVDELAKTDGDDGQALVSAITGNYDATQANEDRLDKLLTTAADGTESGRIVDIENQLTDADGNPIDLTNLGDTEAVTKNTNDITALDGRVAENEKDIGQIQDDLYGTTPSQHADAPACADGAGGLVNIANCADARSRHNADDIAEVNDKLMQKKEYIDNLAEHIGVDPVTGEGTGEGGMSRIDMNAAAIDAEEKARMEADTALGGRIDAEAMARADADTALGGRIDAEAMARADADTALGMRIDGEAMARADADVHAWRHDHGRRNGPDGR